MIIIESVRLRNFRAIKEAYFRPLEQGITGIFGPNGAGKTSILSGVMFALFGIKPPGVVSIGHLRRVGSETDECSVSVVFKHLGQEIEVIREIKGPKNTVLANIYVDGREETVTTPTAAKIWVAQRLGIDATGFLTAFVVRQKELDQLVQVIPSKRKQIIERLAGIETLNNALKMARKEEFDTKMLYENTKGSQENVQEAENVVELYTKALESLKEHETVLITQLNTAKTSEKELSDWITANNDLATQYATLLSQIDSTEFKLDSVQLELKRLSHIETLKGTDYNIEALRAEHRNISNEINNIQTTLNDAKHYRREYTSKISEQKLVLDSIVKNLTSYDKTMLVSETERTVFEEQITKNTEEIKTLQESISSDKGRVEDLRENLKTLEHVSECPTCHTPLSDPEKLKETFRVAEETLLENIQSRENEVNALTEEINTKTSQLNITDEYELLLKQQDENTLLLKNYEQKLEELESDTKLIQKLEELNNKLTQVTEKGIQAKTFLEDKERFTQLTSEEKQLSQKMSQLKQKLDSLGKIPNIDTVNRKKQKLFSVQNELKDLYAKNTRLASEIGSQESLLSTAYDNLKTAQHLWDKKKELLSMLEIRSHTTNAIDKFRQESVASLTPELSDRASDLISDITNGTYTDILIDDDFNISVKNAHGNTRNVGDLSGGEESAVALAIRLAIGMLITHDNPSLLWLDEVMTAQDADRRQAMLETIQRLPYSQIIMVSHMGDSEEISDKIVSVIPNIEEGSVLQESGSVFIEE